MRNLIKTIFLYHIIIPISTSFQLIPNVPSLKTTGLFATTARSARPARTPTRTSSKPFEKLFYADFTTSRGEVLNPYQTLNLTPYSTKQQLKQSYYKLSQNLHPNGKFYSQKTSEDLTYEWEKTKSSYDVLKSTKLKTRYDRLVMLSDPQGSFLRFLEKTGNDARVYCEDCLENGMNAVEDAFSQNLIQPMTKEIKKAKENVLFRMNQSVVNSKESLKHSFQLTMADLEVTLNTKQGQLSHLLSTEVHSMKADTLEMMQSLEKRTKEYVLTSFMEVKNEVSIALKEYIKTRKGDSVSKVNMLV